MMFTTYITALRIGSVQQRLQGKKSDKQAKAPSTTKYHFKSLMFKMYITYLIYYMFYDTHCTMSSCLWWYSYCNCSASSTLVTDVICIASRSNSAAFLWQITASSKRLHKIWLSAFLSFRCAWKIYITVRLLASREGTHELKWFHSTIFQSTY